MDKLNAAVCVKGRVRPYRVFPDPNHDLILADGTVMPGRWNLQAGWSKNDVLYSWGALAARALTQPGTNYRINGMYMEFKNVANPGDAISPPSFDRSGGRAYYDGLSSSPDTDYLRVPLVTSTLDNSDQSLFTDVNRMTFFAMSQGIVGANGKPFSDADNSKVYGGALVGIVDLGDRTQDVIFSRFYFNTAKQQVKLSTSQIGFEWQLALV